MVAAQLFNQKKLKKYSRPYFRLVATVLVSVFLCQEVSHAALVESLPVNLSPRERLLKNPSLLKVPSAYATLKEIHAGSNGRFVVLMQDAHCNFSGQSNLAATLEEMGRAYDTRLIVSEGGEGDCSLTELRPLASKAVWQVTAKKFLLEGKIAGEEYLNLVGEKPVRIIGGEDMTLYRQSVEAYAELAGQREKILPYLGRIASAVQSLKNRHYPKSVLDYEKSVKKNENDFEPLLVLARLAQLDLSRYPKLLFLESLEHSKPLAYTEYLREVSRLDLDLVMREMRILEDEAIGKSLEERASRILRAIDRFVKLLDTAYRIRMTTDEFEEWVVNESDFSTRAYLAFLNTRLIEAGRAGEIIEFQDILEKGKKSLEGFYKSVSARDRAFVKNTEKALDATKEKMVFMIAGGYHTAHLKKLFREKGYSVAVVTPRVTQETNQVRYERALLEPFQKIKQNGFSKQTADLISSETHREKSRFAQPVNEDGARPMLAVQSARLATDFGRHMNEPSVLTALALDASGGKNKEGVTLATRLAMGSIGDGESVQVGARMAEDMTDERYIQEFKAAIHRFGWEDLGNIQDLLQTIFNWSIIHFHKGRLKEGGVVNLLFGPESPLQEVSRREYLLPAMSEIIVEELGDNAQRNLGMAEDLYGSVTRYAEDNYIRFRGTYDTDLFLSKMSENIRARARLREIFRLSDHIGHTYQHQVERINFPERINLSGHLFPPTGEQMQDCHVDYSLLAHQMRSLFLDIAQIAKVEDLKFLKISDVNEVLGMTGEERHSFSNAFGAFLRCFSVLPEDIGKATPDYKFREIFPVERKFDKLIDGLLSDYVRREEELKTDPALVGYPSMELAHFFQNRKFRSLQERFPDTTLLASRSIAGARMASTKKQQDFIRQINTTFTELEMWMRSGKASDERLSELFSLLKPVFDENSFREMGNEDWKRDDKDWQVWMRNTSVLMSDHRRFDPEKVRDGFLAWKELWIVDPDSAKAYRGRWEAVYRQWEEPVPDAIKDTEIYKKVRELRKDAEAGLSYQEWERFVRQYTPFYLRKAHSDQYTFRDPIAHEINGLMFRILALDPSKSGNVERGRHILKKAQEELWSLLQKDGHPWTTVFSSMEEWLLMPTLYYLSDPDYPILGERIIHYVSNETLALRIALFGLHFRKIFSVSTDIADVSLMKRYLEELAGREDFEMTDEIASLIVSGIVASAPRYLELLKDDVLKNTKISALLIKAVETFFKKKIDGLTTDTPKELPENMMRANKTFSANTVGSLLDLNRGSKEVAVSLRGLATGRIEKTAALSHAQRMNDEDVQKALRALSEILKTLANRNNVDGEPLEVGARMAEDIYTDILNVSTEDGIRNVLEGLEGTWNSVDLLRIFLTPDLLGCVHKKSIELEIFGGLYGHCIPVWSKASDLIKKYYATDRLGITKAIVESTISLLKEKDMDYHAIFFSLYSMMLERGDMSDLVETLADNEEIQELVFKKFHEVDPREDKNSVAGQHLSTFLRGMIRDGAEDRWNAKILQWLPLIITKGKEYPQIFYVFQYYELGRGLVDLVKISPGAFDDEKVWEVLMGLGERAAAGGDNGSFGSFYTLQVIFEEIQRIDPDRNFNHMYKKLVPKVQEITGNPRYSDYVRSGIENPLTRFVREVQKMSGWEPKPPTASGVDDLGERLASLVAGEGVGKYGELQVSELIEFIEKQSRAHRKSPEAEAGVVFMAGAGISFGAGLPTWFGLRKTLIQIFLELLGATESVITHASHVFSENPYISPERTIDTLDREIGGVFQVFKALEGSEPTANHRWIAKQVLGRNFSHVLTLNWDTLIERAMGEAGFWRIISIEEGGDIMVVRYENGETKGHPQRVHLDKVKKGKVRVRIKGKTSLVPLFFVHDQIGDKRMPLGQLKRLEEKGIPLVYKIHGSAEDGREETLLADLQGVGHFFPKDLEEILRHFFSQNHVVVAGLSARDPDVTPALKRIGSSLPQRGKNGRGISVLSVGDPTPEQKGLLESFGATSIESQSVIYSGVEDLAVSVGQATSTSQKRQRSWEDRLKNTVSELLGTGVEKQAALYAVLRAAQEADPTGEIEYQHLLKKELGTQETPETILRGRLEMYRHLRETQAISHSQQLGLEGYHHLAVLSVDKARVAFKQAVIADGVGFESRGGHLTDEISERLLSSSIRADIRRLDYLVEMQKAHLTRGDLAGSKDSDLRRSMERLQRSRDLCVEIQKKSSNGSRRMLDRLITSIGGALEEARFFEPMANKASKSGTGLLEHFRASFKRKVSELEKNVGVGANALHLVEGYLILFDSYISHSHSHELLEDAKRFLAKADTLASLLPLQKTDPLLLKILVKKHFLALVHHWRGESSLSEEKTPDQEEVTQWMRQLHRIDDKAMWLESAELLIQETLIRDDFQLSRGAVSSIDRWMGEVAGWLDQVIHESRERGSEARLTAGEVAACSYLLAVYFDLKALGQEQGGDHQLDAWLNRALLIHQSAQHFLNEKKKHHTARRGLTRKLENRHLYQIQGFVGHLEFLAKMKNAESWSDVQSAGEYLRKTQGFYRKTLKESQNQPQFLRYLLLSLQLDVDGIESLDEVANTPGMHSKSAEIQKLKSDRIKHAENMMLLLSGKRRRQGFSDAISQWGEIDPAKFTDPRLGLKYGILQQRLARAKSDIGNTHAGARMAEESRALIVGNGRGLHTNPSAVTSMVIRRIFEKTKIKIFFQRAGDDHFSEGVKTPINNSIDILSLGLANEQSVIVTLQSDETGVLFDKIFDLLQRLFNDSAALEEAPIVDNRIDFSSRNKYLKEVDLWVNSLADTIVSQGARLASDEPITPGGIAESLSDVLQRTDGLSGRLRIVRSWLGWDQKKTVDETGVTKGLLWSLEKPAEESKTKNPPPKLGSKTLGYISKLSEKSGVERSLILWGRPLLEVLLNEPSLPNRMQITREAVGVIPREIGREIGVNVKSGSVWSYEPNNSRDLVIPPRVYVETLAKKLGIQPGLIDRRYVIDAIVDPSSEGSRVERVLKALGIAKGEIVSSVRVPMPNKDDLPRGWESKKEHSEVYRKFSIVLSHRLGIHSGLLDPMILQEEWRGESSQDKSPPAWQRLSRRYRIARQILGWDSGEMSESLEKYFNIKILPGTILSYESKNPRRWRSADPLYIDALSRLLGVEKEYLISLKGAERLRILEGIDNNIKNLNGRLSQVKTLITRRKMNRRTDYQKFMRTIENGKKRLKKKRKRLEVLMNSPRSSNRVRSQYVELIRSIIQDLNSRIETLERVAQDGRMSQLYPNSRSRAGLSRKKLKAGAVSGTRMASDESITPRGVAEGPVAARLPQKSADLPPLFDNGARMAGGAIDISSVTEGPRDVIEQELLGIGLDAEEARKIVEATVDMGQAHIGFHSFDSHKSSAIQGKLVEADFRRWIRERSLLSEADPENRTIRIAEFGLGEEPAEAEGIKEFFYSALNALRENPEEWRFELGGFDFAETPLRNAKSLFNYTNENQIGRKIYMTADRADLSNYQSVRDAVRKRFGDHPVDYAFCRHVVYANDDIRQDLFLKKFSEDGDINDFLKKRGEIYYVDYLATRNILLACRPKRFITEAAHYKNYTDSRNHGYGYFAFTGLRPISFDEQIPRGKWYPKGYKIVEFIFDGTQSRFATGIYEVIDLNKIVENEQNGTAMRGFLQAVVDSAKWPGMRRPGAPGGAAEGPVAGRLASPAKAEHVRRIGRDMSFCELLAQVYRANKKRVEGKRFDLEYVGLSRYVEIQYLEGADKAVTAVVYRVDEAGACHEEERLDISPEISQLERQRLEEVLFFRPTEEGVSAVDDETVEIQAKYLALRRLAERELSSLTEGLSRDENGKIGLQEPRLLRRVFTRDQWQRIQAENAVDLVLSAAEDIKAWFPEGQVMYQIVVLQKNGEEMVLPDYLDGATSSENIKVVYIGSDFSDEFLKDLHERGAGAVVTEAFLDAEGNVNLFPDLAIHIAAVFAGQVEGESAQKLASYLGRYLPGLKGDVEKLKAIATVPENATRNFYNKNDLIFKALDTLDWRGAIELAHLIRQATVTSA